MLVTFEAVGIAEASSWPHHRDLDTDNFQYGHCMCSRRDRVKAL